MDLKAKLRHVMDFPKKGVDFIDITTVLQDKDAFKYAMDQLLAAAKDIDFDIIVGPESRGFIFGAPMAYLLNKGFVPIRKRGKLPYKTIEVEYELEYGTDIMEMHADAIKEGQKVLIVDDLLATGGTALATLELIQKTGGVPAGLGFAIELTFLDGLKKFEHFSNTKIVSMVKY